MSQIASRRYAFLVNTYDKEILKVQSAWSLFEDEDLPLRPNATDEPGANVLAAAGIVAGH